MDVKKAYEITNAKIQFVSLVDKAANLKSFLITKAEDGQAAFTTCGRIVRKDADNHFVTGVVYEPLAEDAHGNFMTEEEITKAAYYFAKSGSKVDLQHSFEPLDGATVVESWIAKADFSIGDETIQKGTWLMTVEIADQNIWDAIEKGEITGFSMGGVGNYSKEDVDLENVEKVDAVKKNDTAEQNEKKGVFKKLAAMFGMDVVEKGEMSDTYNERMKSSAFWQAFYTLEDVLCKYDWYSDKAQFASDEETVKEALTEFSTIIQDILLSGEPVTKMIAADEPQKVEKSGKKMSGANRATLQGIYETLGTFIAQFEDVKTDDEDTDNQDDEKDNPDTDNDDDKEDKEVTKAEVEQMVQEAVSSAVAKALEQEQPKDDTPEADTVSKEMVQEMVADAVAKAIAPVLKARGVPTAMNDNGSNSDTQPVEKHFLHGIL